MSKSQNLLAFDSRKKGKEKPPVKLFINDEELEQKDFAKYLGANFDKQLSWSKHIEITNNKLHKRIGILAKPRKYVQEETMKNLFNSFLKPYIGYGNLAWGGAPKTKIEPINRSIKRSIRTMINIDKFDSAKPFYEYLNILPFKENMKEHERALSKRSLAYTANKLWNQEVPPIDIKSVKTIEAFSKTYRKHLLSNINA